jgi:uncharacterized membrane protein YhaH (DUF805 family)
MSSHVSAKLWVLLNLAGVVAYLWLASTLWVQPGEEGEPGGPGDAFYWLFVLVPILGGSLAVNMIALAVIVRRLANRGNKSGLFVWLAVAFLWLAVVAYDHHKSVRVIDEKYNSVRFGASA